MANCEYGCRSGDFLYTCRLSPYDQLSVVLYNDNAQITANRLYPLIL